MVTYLLMGLYLAAKAQAVHAAGGMVAYGAADAALLSSILGYWFVDRGLRARAPVHA